jgi:hypothetical protein
MSRHRGIRPLGVTHTSFVRLFRIGLQVDNPSKGKLFIRDGLFDLSQQGLPFRTFAIGFRKAVAHVRVGLANLLTSKG